MKDKEFLTKNKIAHRGIHNLYLENTLPAFEEAIRKNYTIELDVRLSKDNIVVVFHDYNLKRIFDINRNIHDLTLKEIKKYQYIPTLEETLKFIQGKVPILIEIKYDSRIGILEKETSCLLNNYPGQFAIQSFNPLTILWFRLNQPHYIRGYLVHTILPDNFLLHFLFNRNLLKKVIKPDFIGINLTGLKEKQTKKIRQKYMLIGYTIKTREEYQKYKDDADNFIYECSSINMPEKY